MITLIDKPIIIARDSVTVELGDTKQREFYPQIKLIKSPKYYNEFNFSLRLLKDIKKSKVYFDQEKTIQEFSDGTIARFYEFEENYEFDIWLPRRPSNNIIPFSCRSKGLAFYYQPTLNYLNLDGSSWEPNEFGLIDRRPAKVNNSLAVYYAKDQRNNEYKAGKAFHIYRPLCVDASGRSFWCDWILDRWRRPVGIKIPHEAKYPILLDPTLGYTTTGATANEITEGYILTSSYVPFTMSENGTGVDFNLYMNANNGDADITYGVYNGPASGNTPVDQSRVAQTAGATVLQSSGVGLRTQSIGGSYTSGNKYYMCWNANIAASGTVYSFYYDSSGDSGIYYAASAYSAGNLPATWPSSGSQANDRLVTAYINYTVAGGPTNLGLATIGRGAFEGFLRGGH